MIDHDSGGGWLGKYDLIAELPRDGGDDVYLAAVIAPGGYTRLAVIRRLRPSVAVDPTLAARFLAASRVGALLNHANIVETYEISQSPDVGKTFAAMEYLEGQTLARLIDRVGAAELGRGMWLRILVDVLAALHHAHEALDEAGAPLHLAHLRLTPDSVFVTYEGQVKVLDFGKPEVDPASPPRAARYVAPEQARGEPTDRRTDIFAVGVLLWEASSRAPLWGDLDDKAILAELASGHVPSVRKLDAAVPAPLADIIGRALSPDPEDRYSTAMHLQTDLEGFLRASGDRQSPREIGKVVAHAFLEERLRTTTIVDEQLRRLRARSFATGEDEQPLSLLRLETFPPSSPKRSAGEAREMATAPRSFHPVAPPSSSGSRRAVWITAAVVVIVGALTVFYVR